MSGSMWQWETWVLCEGEEGDIHVSKPPDMAKRAINSRGHKGFHDSSIWRCQIPSHFIESV